MEQSRDPTVKEGTPNLVLSRQNNPAGAVLKVIWRMNEWLQPVLVLQSQSEKLAHTQESTLRKRVERCWSLVQGRGSRIGRAGTE